LQGGAAQLAGHVERLLERAELSTPNMRAITALLVLREHVIRPLLAGVQSPPSASKPTTWTAADRHYDQLQRDMQPLFHELGIAA